MRAVSPVRDGHVVRGGLRVLFVAYGEGAPTIAQSMPDAIVQSRAWRPGARTWRGPRAWW